jgi:peroxiredoxin Q/BCP
MRLNIGDTAPLINLPELKGNQFQSVNPNNRVTLIAFHRFAGCPFCNLRLHQLIQRHVAWKDRLDVIVIFDSSLENLQAHATDHQPPFSVLADQQNIAYRAYGIEYSWFGVIKGAIFRFPTMLRALYKGYIPKSMEGKINTMPASFIVDKEGIIQLAYYGQDEGDYLPFEQIEAFLNR